MSTPEAGRVEWRGVVGDALRGIGTDRLAGQVVERLAAESEVLRGQPGLRELALRSTAANLELVADLLNGTVDLAGAEPPPQAVAFVRELARRNVAMTEVARSYGVAQHLMWRSGVDALRAAIADGPTAAAAIEAYTDATLATGEVLMGRALERFSQERDQWVRSVDAVRRATVQELLSGAPVDADAASARLRYELGRTHVGFVLWSDDGDPVGPGTAVGARSALIVPMGEGVTAGWAPAGELDSVERTDANLAVGLPGAGVDGFRATHLEAMEARRVARLTGATGWVEYADVALIALLTADLERARAFVDRELGELAEPEMERLADTALELLEQQGSPRRAAQRLGLHENTVAKRARAATEVLGRPIDERPAETLAALTILRALRRSPA